MAETAPMVLSSTDSLPPPAPSPPPRSSTLRSLATYLDKAVDTKQCSSISVYACFLTGFSSAVAFTVSPSRWPLSAASTRRRESQLTTTGMLRLAWLPDRQRRAASHCHCAHIRSTGNKNLRVSEGRSAGAHGPRLLLDRHVARAHRRSDWGKEAFVARWIGVCPGPPRHGLCAACQRVWRERLCKVGAWLMV
jgi:hypothetical protein